MKLFESLKPIENVEQVKGLLAQMRLVPFTALPLFFSLPAFAEGAAPEPAATQGFFEALGMPNYFQIYHDTGFDLFQ